MFSFLPLTKNSSKLGTNYMELQEEERKRVSQGSRLYPSLSLCSSKINITRDLEEGLGQVRARAGRKPLPRLLTLPTVYCKNLILNKFVYGCGQQFTNLDSIWSGFHVCGLVGERMTGCVCALCLGAQPRLGCWRVGTPGRACGDSSGIQAPSDWKCNAVRERVERKGRMSAGPGAVLRFCSSVEIFVTSEKNFPNTFFVPS